MFLYDLIKYKHHKNTIIESCRGHYKQKTTPFWRGSLFLEKLKSELQNFGKSKELRR